MIQTGWVFFDLFFIILSCVYYWYPLFLKNNMMTNITIRERKIGEVSRQISFWGLAWLLMWYFQLSIVISAFLSAYVMFLSSYICYYLAKHKFKKQSIKTSFDYNGYVRYLLVAGGFWIISNLFYYVIYSNNSYRLSLLDYMNYSLLPWLTVVHELYPSKYLMRSRKVSRLLLLASAIDVALMWIFNFK